MMSAGGPVAPSVSVAVTDSGHVGEVRRTVARLCRRAGLDRTLSGRAGDVAGEAASNVLEHGGGGEVVVSQLGAGPDSVIELLALDRGPGIPDVDKALADGRSTAGARGTGLAAMRRQSTVFEVYGQPGGGTAVLSRVGGAAARAEALEIGAVCVAKPDETECGDVWSVEARPGGARIVVADGLGHGPPARDAALAAVRAILGRPPGAGRALEEAHLASRATRGAAVAVAEMDFGAGEVRYAGFGNIAGMLLGPDRAQSMVSMNGTAGQGILKPREFGYRFVPGVLLVMSSDGLDPQWSMDTYPGLAPRDPSLVAGVLYRDHSRRRDDVTVVAARRAVPVPNAPGGG
jgi:anti-sigma regulatory factor (Ser/Thr protein kinase)